MGAVKCSWHNWSFHVFIKRYDDIQHIVRYDKFFEDFPESFVITSAKGFRQTDKNHKQFLVLLTDFICNMKGENHVNSILISAETTLIFRVSSLDVILFRMTRVIQKYREGRSRGNFYLFCLNIWITDAFLISKNSRKSLRTSFLPPHSKVSGWMPYLSRAPHRMAVDW